MPSSGNPAITVTRNSFITEVFRKMRVLAEGGTISTTQVDESTPRINYIIAKMASDGLPLWTYSTLIIPMVAGQVAYTIGPSVLANVNTVRPLRLFDGSFIRDSTPTVPNDTPLRMLSRFEYLQYGNKTATGIPNSIYFDSHIDTPGAPLTTSPSTGLATLYVYTTMQAGVSRSIYCNVQRPLYAFTQGVGGAAEEFDFPQEWYLPLVYACAAELADDYEVPEQRIARLEATRDRMVASLFDWSVETPSTTFAAQTMGFR